MRLKDCTKEELLFVIKRLQFYAPSDWNYYIQRALCDVEEKRRAKKSTEARQLLAYATQKLHESARLLEPYDGKPISDIPLPVLEQADAAMNEARAADTKWMKLMGIKSAPAKKVKGEI